MHQLDPLVRPPLLQLQDDKMHFLLAPGCYRDKTLEGQQDKTAYLAHLDRIHSSAWLGSGVVGLKLAWNAFLLTF